MQIKTITCHDVYNLGASLQAYALQTYLQSIGHDVQIIDYKPDYLSQHYKLWSVPNNYNKPFICILYLLAKLPGRLISLKRKKVFDDFTQKYLNLTERYHSNEELKDNPPLADVYIAGSDQIWNTLFPNGKDPAFYLDFAPKGKKKITYAASFATSDVSEEYVPFVTQMLANLDAISLREKSSLPLLSKLGRKDEVAVCDPVFLLDAEQWASLLPSLERNPYVLVYDFEHSQKIQNIAKFIAKEKQMEIISVGPFKEKYAKENFVNAGPLEFINLIRHCDYFISNSFHGTAFSLIFKKNFFVVNREEGINERMLSLLSDLLLQDRIVSNIGQIDLNSIDYTIPSQRINELISFSKEYLKAQLK